MIFVSTYYKTKLCYYEPIIHNDRISHIMVSKIIMIFRIFNDSNKF